MASALDLVNSVRKITAPDIQAQAPTQAQIDQAMYAPGGNQFTYTPPAPAPVAPQPLTQAESIASYIQTPPPPPVVVAPPVVVPEAPVVPPTTTTAPVTTTPTPTYTPPPPSYTPPPPPPPPPVATIDEAKVKAAQDEQARIQAQYAAQAKGIMESVKPYVSSQAAQIEQIRQQTFNQPFAYNPTADNSLKQAQQQSMQSVQEEMNRRGILNSTVTTDRAQKVAQELVPQYEAMAYTKFNQNIQNQLSNINVLKGLDETAYNQYKSDVDVKLKNLDLLSNLSSADINLIQNNINQMYKTTEDKRAAQLQQIQIQDKEIQRAQDRTEALGYVSNQDAIVLGIPAGTPSKAAAEEAARVRDRLDASKVQIEQSKTIAQNDYELDKKRNEDLIALKQQQENKENAKINFATQIQGQLATIPATIALTNLQKLTPTEIAQMGAENYSKLVADTINRIPVDKKNAEDAQVKKEAVAAANLIGFLQKLPPEEAIAQMIGNKASLIQEVGATNFDAILKEQQTKIETNKKDKIAAAKAELDAQQTRGEITAKQAELELKKLQTESELKYREASTAQTMAETATIGAKEARANAESQANIEQSRASAESSRASAASSYATAAKTVSGKAEKPPTATELKDKLYSVTRGYEEDAKVLSVEKIKEHLYEDKPNIVADHGEKAFDDLWNTTLKRAIEVGAVKARGLEKKD